ncbi:MAG: TIGR02391 family protein [Anaerolineales bacterium]|nr:TIGR02391 family protein [Anaerolineales bacterium]
MTVSRPIPKALLKKMFLKVLHEHHRPGGCYQKHAWGLRSILRPKLAEFFNIAPLTDEEYEQGLRGVYELERDGYIMQDSTQSNDVFKVLTERGKQEVEQSLDDMELPTVDIDQLLTRDDLRSLIHDDYLLGDYEIAIFKTFRRLEELVRTKAQQPPTVIGADLMSKAFSPNNGALTHPNAQTRSEQEGLHLLFRGAIMWFKNPSSHRSVGYANPEEAAQVLAFANLLLDLVDQC